MAGNYQKISAIVVTYNATRNNWLHKCLDSLQNATVKTNIIVIDNASTDDTVNIIKKQYPEITLIESPTNLGFGKANNIGLENALRNGADYFFLLNQDAWVESETLQKLIQGFEKNKDYGIVSPLHLNGEGSALDFNFSNYISPNHCKNLYSDYVLNKVENRIYESGFINAAAWLVSKECLRKVGGFSPTFFHYGEDVNYIQRLKYKNLKIGIYPFATIYHDRENRGENSFFNAELQKKRKFQLRQSNPLLPFTIDQDIASYKSKLKRRKILFDKQGIDFFRKEINFMRELRDEIYENRKKSMSDEKFIFLDKFTEPINLDKRKWCSGQKSSVPN